MAQRSHVILCKKLCGQDVVGRSQGVCSRALQTWRMIGVGVPQPTVPVDLCHAPPTPTLAHPNPSLCSHNELCNRGQCPVRVCLWRVGDCVGVLLVHPPRKYVVLGCWGCGGMALTSLHAFRYCGGCAVLVARFVDFRWASDGQSSFRWEWVSLRDSMVLFWGVSWPLLSGLASGHWSKWNEHFRL